MNDSPTYTFATHLAGPILCPAGWLRHGPVRRFSGRYDRKGHIDIRFRLQGSDVTGRAVLDSGYPDVMVSSRFAAVHGLKLDHEMWMEVRGIGGQFARVPTTRLSIELPATEGADLKLSDLAAVHELSDEVDLLVGLNVLSLGIFTIDGPAGTWEWKIDDSRIVNRRAEA